MEQTTVRIDVPAALLRAAPLVVAILITCGSIVAVAAEDDAPKPLAVAVVRLPGGEGDAAKLASSLVPGDSPGRFSITSVESLEAAPSDAERAVEEEAQEATRGAEEAALAFNLVLAAQLRRKAADILFGTALTALKPDLVSERLLAAGAASAEAGEADLALLYFRRALAVDSGVAPGPTISPRGKTVFNEAVAAGPAPLEPPHNRVLVGLCAALGVDGVLWIAVGRHEGALVVSDKLVFAGESSADPATRHNPPDTPWELEGWARGERQRLRGGVESRLPAEEEPEVKPWYRKWWVWTLVGGVVAGGAAAGIVVGVQQQEDVVDVVVHH